MAFSVTFNNFLDGAALLANQLDTNFQEIVDEFNEVTITGVLAIHVVGNTDYIESLNHNLMEFIWENTLSTSNFDSVIFGLGATSDIDSSATQTNDPRDDFSSVSGKLYAFNTWSKAGSTYASFTTGSGAGYTDNNSSSRTSVIAAASSASPYPNGTQTAIADGVDAFNFKVAGKKVRVSASYRIESVAPTGSPSWTGSAKIQISDGTTHVDLKTVSTTNGGDVSETGRVDLIFDATAQTVDLYINNVLDTSGISLSALSSYFLRGFADKTAGSSTVTISFTGQFTNIRFIVEDRDVELIRNSATAGATVKGAILTSNLSNNINDTPEINLSADGGTDFTLLVEDTDTDLLTASQGTTVVAKFVYKHPAGGDFLTGTIRIDNAQPDGLDFIDEYGIMWREA